MDEREQKMLIECLTRVIEMRADRIRALEADLAAARQELAEAKKNSERLDWLENTWGVLAGCVTNLGHGDEWYWRFNWPEDKPGTHGPTVRLAIDAARAAEESDAD